MSIGRLDSRAAEKELDIDALVGWALLMARAGRMLSEEAGFWGRYRGSFEAYGYEGVDVKDTRSSVFSYRPCRDRRIVLDATLEATELRARSIDVGATLFRRMLWAFGQYERMWENNQIVSRLVMKKREIG